MVVPILVVAVAGLAAVTAFIGSPDSPRRRGVARVPGDAAGGAIARVRALRDRGDLEGARAALGAAPEDEPGREQEARRLADALADRGSEHAQALRWAESVRDFDWAVSVVEPSARTLVLRAAADYRRWHYSGGTSRFKAGFAAALGKDTRGLEETLHARALGQVGRARFVDDPEAGGPMLDRAAALAPDDPWVYYLRGAARLERWRSGADRSREPTLPPMGFADLDRALELQPDFVYALVERGWARYADGFPDAAIPDLERAVALAPRYSIAWIRLATASHYHGDHRRLEGRVREAIEHLERSVEAFDRAIELRERPPLDWRASRAVACHQLGLALGPSTAEGLRWIDVAERALTEAIRDGAEATPKMTNTLADARERLGR